MFCGVPTSPEFTLAPSIFRTVLASPPSRCDGSIARVRRPSRQYGSAPSGVSTVSKTSHQSRRARENSGIFREAVVRTNVKLRDMNVTAPAADERDIEVLVWACPFSGGALTTCGGAATNAATVNGAAGANTVHWWKGHDATLLWSRWSGEGHGFCD